MKKEITEELIRRYLAGSCTDEEAAWVYDWYNSFENDEDPVSLLSPFQREELKERMLDRIRMNIRAGGGTSEERKAAGKGRRNIKPLRYVLTGAAAIALLMGITFFWRPQRELPAKTETVVPLVSVFNDNGTTRKIILPDSSLVWLSPESELQFPRSFASHKTREVTLKGEAFFEVAKDASRPFTVYSGKVITRVLGTSFRIRAYDRMPTEVSVVTGKVSVSIGGKDAAELQLLPDQKVVYSEQGGLLEKSREKDSCVIRLWEKVSLSFDNVPVQEVIAALNGKFGVHIHTDEGKIKHYLLNADFTDQNLPDILEMLEGSLDVHYRIDNNDILLYSTIP